VRKQRVQRSELQMPSSPGWMTTYADMVTLLLTFFVLLLSFASIDKVKFSLVSNSLQGALSILKGTDSILEGKVDISRRMEIFNEMKQLESVAADMGYEDAIQVEVTETGMLVNIGDRVLFGLGEASLKPEAFPVLELVAQKLRDSAKEVFVSGHTDNVPITSGKFRNNWELSSARALSVVEYFISDCNVPPDILAATGYSEFHPIAPNDSAPNRRKNRRVEILITWQ